MTAPARAAAAGGRGGLTLRAAQADDVPALAALGRASFVAKFGHLYRAHDLAAFLEDVYAPATIAAELASPERRYRLAELEGALVGYCKLAFPSGLARHHHAVRPLELKQLYTAPGMTGRGIGTALMDWTVTEARGLGADAIQLSVFSENTDAQRFYERHGFVKTADIDFWVGTHRDEEFLFVREM